MAISFLKVFTGSRFGYQNKVTEPETLAEDSDDEPGSVKPKKSNRQLAEGLLGRRQAISPRLSRKSHSNHQLSSDLVDDKKEFPDNTSDGQWIVQSTDQVEKSKGPHNAGGPFSLVLESMCPSKVIRRRTRCRRDQDNPPVKQSDDRSTAESASSDDDEWLCQYDEYGFVVKECDQSSAKDSSEDCEATKRPEVAMISFVEELPKRLPSQDFLDFCELTPKANEAAFLFDQSHVQQQKGGQDIEDPFSPRMAQVSADPQKTNESTVVKWSSEGDKEQSCKQPVADKGLSRWLTYLQLQYNHSCSSRFRWSQVELRLRRSAALDQLVEQSGVPHSMRSQLWMRFGEAAAFRSASRWSYARLCAASEHVTALNDSRIGRVLPANRCFQPPDGIGLNRLSRLLRVMRWLQREQPIVRWAETGQESRRLGGENQENNGSLDDDDQDEGEEEDETDDENGAKNSKTCSTFSDQSETRWRLELNVPLVAAYLLLTCEEQDAFWLLLCTLNEAECVGGDSSPKDKATTSGFHSGESPTTNQPNSLTGRLVAEHCPQVFEQLCRLDIDLWLLCNQWIASLFAGWLPNTNVMLRLWDLQFYHGLVVHYQLLLGLLQQAQPLLLQTQDTAKAFRILTQLPQSVQNEQKLLKYLQAGKRLLTALPHTRGWINSGCPDTVDPVDNCLSLLDSALVRQWNENPSAGQALKAQLRSARLRGSGSKQRAEHLQVKNVRQTTILMELQETVEAIACHFSALHPQLRVDLSLRQNDPEVEQTTGNSTPTQSSPASLKQPPTMQAATVDSHTDAAQLRRMLCTFSRKVDQMGSAEHRLSSHSPTVGHPSAMSMNTTTPESPTGDSAVDQAVNSDAPSDHQSCAIALIDFRSEQLDELNFRQSQLIRILDDRDEHCWIGQIRQRVGWFPAKFVRPLDESQGEYLAAGDDAVNSFINDLVRGRLGAVMKCVFGHGLRKGLGLFTLHPWMLVEEIAERLRAIVPSVGMGRASSTAHTSSKTALSQCFRLNDSGRQQLTPKQQFVAAVEQINSTHAQVPMDVRMRSWMCLGINQRQLHRWFALYCEHDAILMSKHYHRWSYVTSPASKLIQAQLR